MSRTLVVTNDFPPRPGSIASFVRTLVRLLSPTEVVVYTASMRGDAAYDALVGFPVLRDPARTLLPTAKVRAGVVDAFQAYGCDRVLFGATAPLGLLAPALREAGATRLIGITHTQECWWARLPATRQLLRRIGDALDVLTYLGDGTRAVIAPALSRAAAGRMVRLTPGVDPEVFRPGSGGQGVRARYGIGPSDQVVVSVAPLTRANGQDLLIRALPDVLADVPSARLLLVGGGQHGNRLADLARSLGVSDRVLLTGAVRWTDTPAYLDAGNVFALLRRSGLGGLVPEPFDPVVLAAQSSGVPVVISSTAGWSDTVLAGETGFRVAGESRQVADRLVELLGDPRRAAAMGQAGRAWVERAWTWDQIGTRLGALIGP